MITATTTEKKRERNVLTIAEFHDQRLRGNNTFRGVTIDSDLIIRAVDDSGSIGSIYIIDSLLMRNLDIHGLIVNGDFSLNGTTINGDLLAQGTTFTKPVRLIGTKIGNLNIVNARFLSDILCGDNVSLAMRLFMYTGRRVHVCHQAIDKSLFESVEDLFP